MEHRRPTALLAVAGTLLLAGCQVTLDADVGADGLVTLSGTAWSEFVLEAGDDRGPLDACTILGLRQTSPGMTPLQAEPTTDPADPQRAGCRFSGRLPAAELYPRFGVTAVQADGRWLVEAPPIALNSVGRTRNGAGLLADATVRFPAEVLAASDGLQVSGREVRYLSGRRLPADGLRLSVQESPEPFPGAGWILPALAGLGAGLALGTGGLLASRRLRRGRS